MRQKGQVKLGAALQTGWFEGLFVLGQRMGDGGTATGVKEGLRAGQTADLRLDRRCDIPLQTNERTMP
jgi:hypothetical protein